MRIEDEHLLKLTQSGELSHMVTIFLRMKKKEGTKKAYRQALYPLVDAFGESMPVTEIEPIHMADYWGRLLDTTKYSKATYYKHGKSLRAFFNWLVNLGIIIRSPALAFRLEKPSRYRSREKAMTEGEYEKLLQYIRLKTPRGCRRRYEALILFMGDTGCRAAGATGLRWQNVDLDNFQATVTEKGDKTRIVWFGEYCTDVLREWQFEQAMEDRNDGDYVFGRWGGQMTPYSLSQIIRRLCIAAGIRSLGSHSLRHRKAHQLADAKITPSVASTVLGHSAEVFMASYAPADFNSAQAAVKSLSASNSSPKKQLLPEPEAEKRKIIDLSQYLGTKNG